MEKSSKRSKSGDHRSGKSKKEKKEKKGKRGDDGGDAAQESWLGRFCVCSQVSCCPAKEKIEAEKGERPRAKEKKKRHKSKTSKAVPTGDSQETTAPESALDNCADDDSGETCTSFASESAYSRQSTARSTVESSRASQGGGRSGRGSRSKGAGLQAATPSGGGDGIRVVNLGDLRGQDMPLDALGKNDQPLSARSGRSEGGRSSRSCRSDAKSEGGQSVASVSVRKYMGYLSEPKSPAEVKKMVKEFVRQMVKGREMSVLRADGALRPVLCGLARSLDVFKIKSGENVRRVKLLEVERVVHGAPEDLADLETPLDDSCATLELEEGECISFKFAERKAAELFTLCMQLFIDGQKTK